MNHMIWYAPRQLVAYVIAMPAPANVRVWAAYTLVGYYWALVCQAVLRSFALGCLRGWS